MRARSLLARRPEVVLGLAASAVSGSLALRHLRDALWQDEVASARIIEQASVVDAVHRVQQTESTPPLWYMLAWLLHRSGVGIMGVRLLSLLASAAAAALLVIFARRTVRASTSRQHTIPDLLSALDSSDR